MKIIIASILAALCATVVQAGVHTIIIDAGHGGSKYAGSQKARTLSSPNNATSPSGLQEKILTLELAREVKKQLDLLARNYPKTKIKCVLTRNSDKNIDFGKRAKLCAQLRPAPAAIISLHFNASSGHNALGSLALVNHPGRNPNYRSDHAFADGLTRATSRAVQRFLPKSHARKPMTDAHLHKGVGSNFFYQLSKYPHLKSTPRCFLEVEFIDRRDVDQALLQKRKKSFPVIAKAIAHFLYQHCQKQ